MADKRGCRETIHCVNYGFCHRCDRDLSNRVRERWHNEDGGSEYEKRYLEIIAEEMKKNG